jgi:sugar/nucleoside kinase (ribokinase family)
MSSILVVGSVARDTLHFETSSHPLVLGGSAVFASLSGALFVPPRLVGVVGTDFPDQAIQLMRDKGIDMTGLEVVEGRTFHWEGRYAPDLASRTTINTELNVFADFHPKIPEAFRDTPYVMLGNIHPSLQIEVLDQIREPKLVIADTMNFWIEGTPTELAEMLERIDVLVINEEEARQLSGHNAILKVARELLSRGPTTVVVKQGEYGALLFHDDEMFSAPAYPCEQVLDPTGAGDAFAGGMLGYIAKQDSVDGDTMRRAIIYASACASFNVEGVSVDRLVQVTPEDVQERYLEFCRLAHFATETELRALVDERHVAE